PQSPDLLLRLREMLAQNREDLLFRLKAAGVGEIEVDDIPNFIEAEAEGFELANFLQAGQRLFGVIVLAMPFALAPPQQTDPLIVANGARCDLASLSQIADAHAVTHGSPQNMTLTSYF